VLELIGRAVRARIAAGLGRWSEFIRPQRRQGRDRAGMTILATPRRVPRPPAICARQPVPVN
jgi:hypothetical protein